MWCNEGLEFIYDLADWERRKTWAALKGVEVTDSPPSLQLLIMRARYNQQRHYEIYIIETDDVDVDAMRTYFKCAAQSVVNLIRARGNQVYSDRVRQDKQYIV
jgi:hypothetical protein